MEDWRNWQNPSGYNRSEYYHGEPFYKIRKYWQQPKGLSNQRPYTSTKETYGYNPSGPNFGSMYHQRPNNVTQSHADSRLTVADILSSMANGDTVTPNTYAAALQFSSGIPTATTPTLTPTTLTNIEQTFIELQSVPPHHQVQNQAGFVPPLVRMNSDNSDISHDSYQSSDKSDDNEWVSVSSARRLSNSNIRHSSIMSTTTATGISSTSITKSGRSTGGRKPIKDDKLTPEEEERRRVRRERNKLAAARCRKRRLDHTNCLILETEGLEEKKAALQNEIQMLQNEKEELEFILQAHKSMCKKVTNGSNVPSNNHVMTSVCRPNSLSITSVHTSISHHNSKLSVNVTDATGIPITTPSRIFSFESLVDGSTGLTPTGLTPVIPSCSSEVHRSSGSDHSSPENITSPTLVSL